MTPIAGFHARAHRRILSSFLGIAGMFLPIVPGWAADTDCPDTAGPCRLVAHWGPREAAASDDLDLGSESFSVACWFRAERRDPGGCLVRKGTDGETAGFHLETDADGRIEVGVRAATPGGALRFRTRRSVTDGAWHHVAVIIDRRKSEAAILVDGRTCELEQAAGSGGSLNEEGIALLFETTQSPCAANAAASIQLAPAQGTPGAPRCVEDIRIYRGALTAAAVKNLFHETAAIASNGDPINPQREN